MHPPHRHERKNDRDWQRDDRHQRRADVPEKNQTNQRDDDAFFDQLLTQCGDGAANQVAAIVNRHDAHTGRQRRLDLFNFLFYGVDDVERVLAVTHHHDAANDFAAPIEFGHAAPDVAAMVDVSNILQVNRRAVFDFENDVLDVLNLFDVAATADVVLGRGDLENLAAHVGVTHLDRVDHVAERDVVSDESVWIEIDLVLLYESADRRDFSDSFY